MAYQYARANNVTRTNWQNQPYINPDMIERARRYSAGNSFIASVVSQYDSRGTLSANQISALENAVSKMENRDSRPANSTLSGSVDVSGIHALFDKAKASGLKRPKFRVEGFELSLAPEHGANAGAVYVKHGEDYFGKVVNGHYFATGAAPVDMLNKLREVADKPMEVAVKYGRLTGNCCMCGLPLSNPESVERGMGPVCAEKWGL